MRTCEACAAFHALEKKCRRKSPAAALIPSSSGKPVSIGFYPGTEAHEWCCEWIPLENVNGDHH